MEFNAAAAAFAKSHCHGFFWQKLCSCCGGGDVLRHSDVGNRATCVHLSRKGGGVKKGIGNGAKKCIRNGVESV